MESTVTVVAVSNILVVHEEMDDTLAHDITRVLFEQHRELAAINPMAATLAIESATTGSPIPYHEGAIRYYSEQNAWAESSQ